MEYLEEYLPYIRYVCKKKKFLKEQWEDMEQFIVKELISIYHKKYVYDDFDWVIRSVIRRKSLDFTAYYIKRNKDLIFENQYKANGDDSENLIGVYLNKPVEDQNIKAIETVELLNNIYKSITTFPHNSEFSDWDREFIEVIMELYNYGNDTSKEEIMTCMGYDEEESKKFNSKLLTFRNKLTKYLCIEF